MRALAAHSEESRILSPTLQELLRNETAFCSSYPFATSDMSSKSRASLEPVEEEAFLGGFKRQRGDRASLPQTSFLFSREIGAYGSWVEGACPSPKRRRCARYFPDSPSIVSLPVSLAQEDSLESMHLSPASSPCRETKPVEWWKQKQKATAYESTHAQACFVCRRTLPASKQETTILSNAPGASGNTLLAFLTPKNSGLAPSWNKPSFHTPPCQPIMNQCEETGNDICSFCERTACGDCIARCEECGDLYCSFCSTTDYCGAMSRTVCLDCNTERQLCRGDEMHID